MDRRTSPLRRPGPWLLGLVACLAGCASVVPPDVDFAASRCQLVLDEGIEGLPTHDLGAILELTRPDGQPDESGAYYVKAMRLAIRELNNNRDIAGKRLRIRVCDTHSDWATGGGQVSRDLATWLIEKAHVQAILADASADTQTIQAITVPKGVLLMAISATSEDLTHLTDQGLVWRVAPSDIYQGAVLAQMVSSTVGEDGPVTVLAVQSPYGDGLVAALAKPLEKRLKSHTFASDGKDIEAAVQASAADAPKAIVVVATAPLAVQIANLRAALPALATVPMFFADGACDGTVATQTLQAGVSLAGVHCTRPGQPPTAVYDNFRERFQARYQLDPANSSYSQHAFDALYCVALAHAWALRQGGPGRVDGAALAEGLRHLSAGSPLPLTPDKIVTMTSQLLAGKDINVEGASGPLDFNPVTGEAPSGYEDWTLGAKGELASKSYFSVTDLGDGHYAIQPLLMP